MIEEPFHVGELHWVLLPYYGLTNVVAAMRAYQLNEINIMLNLQSLIFSTLKLGGSMKSQVVIPFSLLFPNNSILPFFNLISFLVGCS